MERSPVVDEKVEERRHPDANDWFEKLDSNQGWIKVFSYLTNSSDLTSAYFTCEMFRKHVEQKRKLLLLPQVFQLLRSKNYLTYKTTKEDVLNLRLVSKAFKDAVEKQFLEFTFAKEDWYNDYVTYPIDICFSKNTKEAKKAVKAFRVLLPQSCTSSSFRSVSVKFWIPGGSPISRRINVAELATRFLHAYGDRVWMFDYRNDDKFFEEKEKSFETFIDLVSSLHNLKALWIRLYVSYFGDGDLPVVQHPFPRISSLKHLDFYGDSVKFEHLIADILDKNPGIKSLSLSSCTVLADRICHALGALRLEHFELVFVKRYGEFKQQLAKLTQFDWPLKKLFLVCEAISDWEGSYRASECNMVLRQFRGTLESIRLDLEIVHDGRNQGLRVPNLKVLEGPGCSHLRIRSDVHGFQVRNSWW